MAEFPKGHEALVAAGYWYLGSSKCKTQECGAKILWYRAPSKAMMPIDAITNTPHWLSCPGASNYRREKKRKFKPPPPPDEQFNMFEREPGQEG